MNNEIFDFTVIGGGLYGCYASLILSQKGFKVILIEKEDELLNRSSSNNQLRIHNGYHYPRSLSTSLNSNKYFNRFIKEFKNCINKDFKNIYLVSKKRSLSNRSQFEFFCNNSKIPLEEKKLDFINYKEIESSYITEEYVYDPFLLKKTIGKRIEDSNVNVLKKCLIKTVQEKENFFLNTNLGLINSKSIINCTYSSINEINNFFKFKEIDLKHELCEIIICKLDPKYKDYGFTILDGPFISIMPYGKTGFHTLSSVRFTPHKTSKTNYPEFNCQQKNRSCHKFNLENCNDCKFKPSTNFEFMKSQVNLFFNGIDVTYISSNFSIKTIPVSSEISDSRPTKIIKSSRKNKNSYTVFSGKINNIFDLESFNFEI